jgi:hypothetical protein
VQHVRAARCTGGGGAQPRQGVHMASTCAGRWSRWPCQRCAVYAGGRLGAHSAAVVGLGDGAGPGGGGLAVAASERTPPTICAGGGTRDGSPTVAQALLWRPGAWRAPVPLVGVFWARTASPPPPLRIRTSALCPRRLRSGGGVVAFAVWRPLLGSAQESRRRRRTRRSSLASNRWRSGSRSPGSSWARSHLPKRWWATRFRHARGLAVVGRGHRCSRRDVVRNVRLGATALAFVVLLAGFAGARPLGRAGQIGPEQSARRFRQLATSRDLFDSVLQRRSPRTLRLRVRRRARRLAGR